MTVIIIDPNVRIKNNWTFAGFEDVRGPLPEVGDPVVVLEVESGALCGAVVRRIDNDKQLIDLEVPWRLFTPSIYDETDTTEAEFDAMWVRATPVDTTPGSRTFASGVVTKLKHF